MVLTQKVRLQCHPLKEVKVNNNKILLVGAGGFAREIYDYLSQSNFEYNGYKLAGFLSDNDDDLDSFNIDHKIIGNIKSELLDEGTVLIMAVASPSLKEELYRYYEQSGAQFITYVHPTAIIGKYVNLGDGCVICPNVTLTTNISIGSCCTINAHSSIGHDANIGNFCTLSGHCDITGGVKVGDRVIFGSHALVIPSKIVESDSVVGAGSVVIKKVKSGTTVFGNPAKKIN